MVGHSSDVGEVWWEGPGGLHPPGGRMCGIKAQTISQPDGAPYPCINSSEFSLVFLTFHLNRWENLLDVTRITSSPSM